MMFKGIRKLKMKPDSFLSICDYYQAAELNGVTESINYKDLYASGTNLDWNWGGESYQHTKLGGKQVQLYQKQ